MKSKENIVFLGMMGSGKSSIGSLVSQKLNLNFLDVDNEIEKNLKKIQKYLKPKEKSILENLRKKTTLKKLKKSS